MKKKLIKKFTVEIDESLLGIGVKASVGINRDPKLKEVIHKKFMETSEVVSISEVTGRFDIMIDVYAKNLEALHSVVIEKIGKILCLQVFLLFQLVNFNIPLVCPSVSIPKRALKLVLWHPEWKKG